MQKEYRDNPATIALESLQAMATDGIPDLHGAGNRSRVRRLALRCSRTFLRHEGSGKKKGEYMVKPLFGKSVLLVAYQKNSCDLF
jgi:hypothetical protein